MKTDTPETDAKMFAAWRWDTHKMDYVPHGIAFPAELARKMERERNRLRLAMKGIVACGLNCKDALDEAEQMERIAKEALSSEND